MNTSIYDDLENEYEVNIIKDILTRSTVVVIMNLLTEAGAEIHFGDNGSVWISYLRSSNPNSLPS